jgi:hypothetical protein
VAARVRELTRCAVCHDECLHLVRCSNGHGCCVGCELSIADNRCPLCREQRAFVVDGVLPSLFKEWPALRLRCQTCGDVHVPAGQCETHRAWCPEHTFACPVPGCTHLVRARDMKAHVMLHGVPVLLPRDGCYEFFLGLTRVNGEAADVVVRVGEECVLVLTSTSVNRRSLVQSVSDLLHPVLHLSLKAYYRDAAARPVRAVVRQLRVADCVEEDAWVEEHRCGVVPPVIASRETTPASHSRVGPSLTARTQLVAEPTDPDPSSSPLFFLPNTGPSTEVAQHVRRRGIRDLSPAPPHAPPRLPTGLPVALLHIRLLLSAAHEETIGEYVAE